MIATERSTNITVAESTNDITAIEPQNLHNCTKLSLPEVVPVRDSFSYNKEIEQMSKHQVYGKIVLVLLVQLN